MTKTSGARNAHCAYPWQRLRSTTSLTGDQPFRGPFSSPCPTACARGCSAARRAVQTGTEDVKADDQCPEREDQLRPGQRRSRDEQDKPREIAEHGERTGEDAQTVTD